ncbi:MAG: hypothetical protein K1X67_02250 [Fimbriimonadaceae bacterium]|nr:hypothetical protein [Fimbriimonadaceae bacterium]
MKLAGLMVAATTWALTGVASATDFDSVTFTNIQPVQTTNFGLGTLNTHVFTVGGYNLGKVKVTGTLEEINGTIGDFANENKIRVTYPDGRFKDVVLSPTGGYGAPLAINTSFFLAYGAAAPFGGGTWEFRYINTIDDAPTGGVADAQCTVTFTLSDETPPSPPASVNLGTLNNTGQTDPTPSLIQTTAHGSGNIKWYRIVIPEAVIGTKYLDIDTEDTTAFGSNDTEIALYDDTGTLVANDDDDGSTGLSQLSFGPGATARDRLVTGSNTLSALRDGRDGELSAGVYYVCATGFNAIFSSAFGATTTSTATGNVTLNFRTNVIVSIQEISGSITLLDRDPGTEVGQQVTIEIRNVGNPIALHTEVVTLGSGGAYSFTIGSPLAAGNYDVTAKHAKHLRKLLGNQALSATGATGLDLSLINGDSDDDNEVSIGDYAILSGSYNKGVGDSGYDARADLTGDDFVDIADYAILSANYGLLGDD